PHFNHRLSYAGWLGRVYWMDVRLVYNAESATPGAAGSQQ
ncbi:unnamed protein product, partial [marine sediment metagenome]